MVKIGLAVASAALLLPAQVLAWSGESWGSMDRATMESRASTMMHSKWSPRNTITNFGYGSTNRTWYKGTTYTGMAYSQNNPQENWSQFKSLVDNTSGGSTGYGNDCSGFVSIAWKLPSRYTTWTFEDDATRSSGYVSSLGPVGSGQNANLQLGDALNRSSNHIVLFKQRTTGGILAMEQTPWTARQREWSWAQLSQYRPIRRDNISGTATPPPSNGITGIIRSAELNVRTGPGTDFGVAGVVVQNQSVGIECRSDGTTHTGPVSTTNQWYRIGSGRFVSAAHVSVAQSVPICTVSGTVKASSLNVRSGPGSGYATVSSLVNNAKVAIQCRAGGTTHTGTQGTSNQWYRIGSNRFVSAAYVAAAGTVYICR